MERHPGSLIRGSWKLIALDTNVLVYAHRADSPWHTEAHDLVRTFAEGMAPWALPWPCVHEFLAIVTHPRIFDPPTPLEQALRQVEAWVGSPSVTLLSEGSGYLPSLSEQVMTARVAGPRIHDARVAALCEYHGVTELLTVDRDFGRFTRPKVRNPFRGT